jgi:hypothetical protein
MICIKCKQAGFVSGTRMCRNDGRIFCNKLKKLVDKYQECEIEKQAADTPKPNSKSMKK